VCPITGRGDGAPRILARMTTSSTTPEPDEAAFPEPPGGGFAVAVMGGLSAAGSLFLVFAPPLVLAWLAVAAILTGAAVRRGTHVVTVTVAAIAPAVATFVVAQCLTGMWGWLLAGIVVLAVLLLLGTPIGFGIGRLLRSRLAGGYTIIRAILLVTAFLSALGWGLVIGNALAPGVCPAPL
jgi:hypothetical protein